MIRLASTKAIAWGPFNPHIITPGWVRDIGIIDDLQDRAASVTEEDESESLSFSTLDLDWQVDGKSLSVETENHALDCGVYLARVIQELPHTPLWAVAHEFSYTATKEDWAGGPLPQIGNKVPSAFDQIEIESVRWAGLFNRGNARAELMIEADLKREQMIGIHLGYHRRIRETKFKEAAKAGSDATKHFLRDLCDADELLKIVFGQEVKR